MTKDLENNKEIYLVAGFNKAYLKKSEPYLMTMNQNSNVNNVIITLDFDIDPSYKAKFGCIQFVKILPSQIKSPNQNTCMQHGGFLEALKDVDDTSIVIFTDTDIKVQRAFSETDLQLFRNCKDNEIIVGQNTVSSSGDKTSLLDDAEVSRSKISPKELLKRYPEASDFYIYNTGVIATRYKTYCELYEMYNKHWPDFDPLFESYIKQQWLLSYLIQKHFQQRDLPYSIHCNAYSLPLVQDANTKRWCYIGELASIGFKFCLGSDIVVLNHHIKHESELEIRSLKKIIRNLLRISALLAGLCIFFIIRMCLNMR